MTEEPHLNQEVRKIRPSHITANIFMLFLLCFNILLTLAIGTFYWEFWHGTAVGGVLRSPWWLVGNQILGLLVPMFVFSCFGKLHASGDCESPLDEQFRFGVNIVNIVLVIAVSIMLQPAMMLVSALTSLLMPNPVTGLISELAVLPLPMALIIVALTPAICEEWVFRGYILNKYEKQPIAVAAIINGLFFGIIHLNLHQFFYAFAMGIVFVFIVHFTRSIFSAVLAHFVVNAVQYTLGYMSIRYAGPVYDAGGNGELIAAIIALGHITMLTLPLVAGLFYVMAKYNQWRYPDVGEKVQDMQYQNPLDIAFWLVLLVFGAIMVAVMLA